MEPNLDHCDRGTQLVYLPCFIIINKSRLNNLFFESTEDFVTRDKVSGAHTFVVKVHHILVEDFDPGNP